MLRIGSFLVVISILFVAGTGPVQAADESLDASVAATLSSALERGDHSVAIADQLFDDCIRAHGDVVLLLDALKEIYGDDRTDARATEARWIAARLLRRQGDKNESLALFEKLLEHDEASAELWWQVAEMRDMAGKKDESVEAYEKLLSLIDDVEAETRVRLRLAFLDVGKKVRKSGSSRSSRTSASGMMVLGPAGRVVRPGASSSGSSAKKEDPTTTEALVTFASAEGRPVEVRNRCAIVLALLGQPKQAIELFVVEGEGSKRFKGEMRRAEWAIAADDAERAQDFAWRALEVAKTRRDRRYSLAVLVEAYRLDETLQALIDRFAAQENLHDDARQVWIDLLRETGQIDPALELFRADEADFTVEMRRELLEMCRESGRSETLVSAFRELIREEPEQVEWREGLARHYLERGDRASATAVWDGFTDVTDTIGLLMLGADSMRSLGLDELAIECAAVAEKREGGMFPAGMFLFDLHRNRGRMADAEAVLDSLHERAAADAPERMALSEAFEQLGNKKRAVEVLEALKGARKEDTGEDLEMRLAWLHSEVGDEEKAMAGWLALWERVDSVARRRYVEDRLMTTASRLGRLADIAIELEEKLTEGNADARESGLLIRLYSKVGDPVSAAEVIEEYLKHSGGSELRALQEKARVYMQCLDYHNYEKTVRKLMRVDPEGEADYLRQLAMSSLERGRPDEAREVLGRLKELERGADSAEFEAGVLALAGLRDDAIIAYRRGMVANPERIESYLLLANLLRDTRQTSRAVGMFQHLALTAEKDDLFTIAIDGLLNMRAPAPVLEWARRVTYERLTRRHEKMYLYQLISDLSEQVNDRNTMLRSLESAISIAGERRLPLLRELMDLASQPRGDRDKRLAFGRRLIGLGELVPPDVYLSLGEAFLEAGDVTSASKTFSMASEVPDYNAFQRQVAQSFEKARFLEEALRVYERILVSQSSDVSLMLKVGELHEQLGRDPRASELYLRGIELLLSRRPFSTVKSDEPEDDNPYRFYQARNVNDFDQYYTRLLQNFLVATDGGEPLLDELTLQRQRVRDDLARLEKREVKLQRELALFPRIADRAAFHRRVAIASRRPDLANQLDLQLLAAFPEDAELLDTMARARIDWGMVTSARELIEQCSRPENEKQKVRFLVGVIDGDSVPGVLPISEALRLFLPPLIEGRPRDVKTLLQRVDFGSMEAEELESLPVLFAAAVYLEDPELALTYARHWMRVAIKHKKQYELQSILRQVITRAEKSLEVEQRKSLIDFLVTLTVENEKKGADLIPLFPELQRQSPEPLLETEKVIEFIEKYVERSSYGIGPLIALVPAEDRVAVLRRIWPKIQPTRRANFIVDLLAAFQEKVSEELSTFLVDSFETAFDDLDNKAYFGYAISNALSNNRKNSEPVLKIAKLVLEKEPGDLQTRVAYAAGLAEAGRDDEGLEAAKAAFRAALEEKKEPAFRISSSLNRLYELFLPAHLDTLLEVLEEIEKRDGESPELTARRIDLIDRSGDRERLLVALRSAVETHPKDIDLRERLQRQLRTLGYRLESLEILKDIVELEPDNDSYRNRLVSFWNGLQHPIRALEVRRAGEDDEEEEEEKKVEKKAEPIPRPNIRIVKKAIEEEDLDKAQVTFRRLWRNFRVDAGNRGMVIYYPGRGRYDYSWPVTRDPNEKREPYRGGLDSFREEETPPIERVSAYVAMEQDFVEPEIRRRLRSLAPGELEQAGPLYEGMRVALERRIGASDAIAQLVETIREGRAGKIDYVLLLSLFEKDPDRIGADGHSLLSDLAKTVHPQAGGQLRRLARLYARMGAEEEAARLYRWCGSLTTWEHYFMPDQKFPQIQAGELIDEVVENLEGDVREDVIEAILKFGEPEEESYARDGFETRVLETWVKILGPDQALQRCRDLCEATTNLERTVKRSSAKIAARLYARGGEHEQAARCMEISFCNDIRPENAEYYYYYRGWWAPSHQDIRDLFPKDTEGWTNAGDWFRLAADKFREWIESDRIDAKRCIAVMSVLAVRLHESGQTDAAAEILEFVKSTAGELATDQLWIIDIARRIGQEELAQTIERKLLDEFRLNLARVPEVLDHVKESDGLDAALKAGEATAEFTLSEPILDKLIAFAEEAEKPEAAAKWKQTKLDAEAAREELKKNDD